MGSFKFFLIGTTKGTGKNGDWYRISLKVCVSSGAENREYTTDVYTDAVTFGKIQNCPNFTEVDCGFVPNSRGRAVLVMFEQL